MTTTQIHSVSEVAGYLRDLLTNDPVVSGIWINGEIANLARPGSGHAYFTLRDVDATLRCVMFKYSGSGADLLENGAAVIAHGKISIYAARGDLQLVVDMVQPQGVGELQLRFEELRAKLEGEGLFDQSRKRTMPRFPEKIGVVTSPSGAVWHDIQTVIARRYPMVELLLAPTAVQGETAASGIVDALNLLNLQTDVDVIILARGGGSDEDLWPFSEEDVARAIFSSKSPVISGVGHETDVGICDWVADARAPTPSAAAEMAVPDLAAIKTSMAAMVRMADRRVRDAAEQATVNLAGVENRMDRALPDLDSLRIRVDEWLRSSSVHLETLVRSSLVRAEGLGARLEGVSPIGTLSRGYAIVQTVDTGAVVSNSSDLSPGDITSVTLSRGSFESEVVGVTEP